MYLNSLVSLSLLCCVVANQLLFGSNDKVANSIVAAPGQAQYYLMADAGSSVAPTDELKRTNRSLLKWWDDLFLSQNNCCNNNNNNAVDYNNNYALPNGCNSGLKLDNLDPFKQFKLLKKLPDLWGGNQCTNCVNSNQQQPYNNNNYETPGYGAPAPPAQPASYDYAPPAATPTYETPNAAYDGPGDGDAGYVAPTPATDSYAAPPTATYETPAPSYEQPAAPATNDDYQQPAKGQQPPQILYQPIIYLTATAPATLKQQEQYSEPTPSPEPPAYVPEPAIPQPQPAPPTQATAPACNAPSCAGYLPLVGLPVYNYVAPPCQSCQPPPPAPPTYAPPATPPNVIYAAPSCQTPIRLSLYDQPYRVAPELFAEYNYRLGLTDQNRL